MGLDELDVKDKKILYELDLDCRQSNSEIGKKVRLSKQVVEYRIKRMIKEGYIERFATVIDTYKLGITKFKLYLSFENATAEKIKEMIEYLKASEKTEWIASCSGKWDVIAGFVVKNQYEFNDAVKDFEDKFSNYIATRETTIGLWAPHWRKEYLLQNTKPHPVVRQGEDWNKEHIDEIDEKIIRLVVNNARMNIVEMASKLKLTPRVVQHRLQTLKQKKVILFHRFFLNLVKINWIFCKAMIKFKNMTKEKYAKFMEYCNQQKNLAYTISCIGSWDIELDFEVPDFNTFHKIMLTYRDEFSDIIKSYDFIIVMKEEKLDYYPGSLPKLE